MVMLSFCCKDLDFILQHIAGNGIQRPKGFIHEQNGGFSRQSTQHPDALLLTSGELIGILFGIVPIRHGHHGQQFFDPLVGFGFVPLQQVRDNTDVLLDGHVGKKPNLLDDVAHGHAQIVDFDGGDVLAVNQNLPLFHGNQTIEQFQSGGFSAAGRTDEDHKLPVLDGQIEIFDDRFAMICLVDMTIFNHKQASYLW
jgi:hypothetical protein